MDNNELARPCAGNRKFWQTINTECRSRFFAWIRYCRFSMHDAEDAFQESVIKLAKEYDEGKWTKVTEELKNYFFVVCKNKLLDIREQNAGKTALHREAEVADPLKSIFPCFYGDDSDPQGTLLRKCIALLTESEQYFINLCLDPGLSLQEIARITGMSSVHAVSVRKNKIIKKIKKIAKQLLAAREDCI